MLERMKKIDAVLRTNDMSVVFVSEDFFVHFQLSLFLRACSLYNCVAAFGD